MCKRAEWTAELLPNHSWAIHYDGEPVLERAMDLLIMQLNNNVLVPHDEHGTLQLLAKAWERFAKGDVTLMQHDKKWQASLNLSAAGGVMLTHAATADTPWVAILALDKEMKDLVDRALQGKS